MWISLVNGWWGGLDAFMKWLGKYCSRVLLHTQCFEAHCSVRFGSEQITFLNFILSIKTEGLFWIERTQSCHAALSSDLRWAIYWWEEAAFYPAGGDKWNIMVVTEHSWWGKDLCGLSHLLYGCGEQRVQGERWMGGDLVMSGSPYITTQLCSSSFGDQPKT